jgi:hypothetical protein
MFKKTLAFAALLVFSLSANAAIVSLSGVVTTSSGAFPLFAPIGTTLESTLDWDGVLFGGRAELSSGQCFSSDVSGTGVSIASPTCTSGYALSPVLTTGQTTYDGTPAAPGSQFEQPGTTFDGTSGLLKTLAYSEVFDANIVIDYTFIGDGTGTFFAEAAGFGNAGGTFDVATVPLPAAAWLFISALGGLVVAKRKQLKA